MKRPVVTLCLIAAVAAASVVSAEESKRPVLLLPVSALILQEDAAPAPKGLVEAPKEDEPVKEEVKTIKLYEHVKVRDPDHIAPCAEHKLIEVRDPCWKPDPCACGPQEPKKVFVSICVPKVVECPRPDPCGKVACGVAACGPPVACRSQCCACDCQHRKLRHICVASGRYQKFDYGRYRVEVRVRHDHIEVDYDD